jgi:peroxiredoxin Q/BCP
MTNLKEGDPAPSINALDENGEPISLDTYKGKKVILFFYPKDNTPTCTIESCNLRDNYSDLLAKGIEVIGVSADTQRKHQNFIKRFKLPYRLIADTDKKVINDYGVWGEKKFMGRTFDGIHRTTFVINEAGVIEKIFTKVKSKQHTAQILEALNIN